MKPKLNLSVSFVDLSWYERNSARCRPGLSIPGESDKRPALPPALPGTNSKSV